MYQRSVFIFSFIGGLETSIISKLEYLCLCLNKKSFDRVYKEQLESHIVYKITYCIKFISGYLRWGFFFVVMPLVMKSYNIL